mmetsp:Transcript_1900/g.4594  ORF Transcript_1900/g.4594 Transcript_1900/m.4594 type:complete len:395 (+) Transcript_1900:221-1405(+)
MTFSHPSKDDPEIVLSAPSAPPSAPLLAATAPIPSAPGPYAPVSMPVATPLGPPASRPTAAAATAASQGNRKIEKTTNPDGSLAVKVTAAETLPNGSIKITIEYFQIPAHMASSASVGIDAGEPPSGLYLTKMEQRTMPAGTGQAPSSASPRPMTSYPTVGNAAPLQQPTNHDQSEHPDLRRRILLAQAMAGNAVPLQQPTNHDQSEHPDRRRRILLAQVICFIIAIVSIIGIYMGLNSSSHASSRTPPSPWSPPSPPPTVSSRPTVSPSPSASPTVSSPPTTSGKPTSTFDYFGAARYRLVGRGQCMNARGKTTYSQRTTFYNLRMTCASFCSRFGAVGFELRERDNWAIDYERNCICLVDQQNKLGPITGSSGVGDTKCYKLASTPSAASES